MPKALGPPTENSFDYWARNQAVSFILHEGANGSLVIFLYLRLMTHTNFLIPSIQRSHTRMKTVGKCRLDARSARFLQKLLRVIPCFSQSVSIESSLPVSLFSLVISFTSDYDFYKNWDTFQRNENKLTSSSKLSTKKKI